VGEKQYKWENPNSRTFTFVTWVEKITFRFFESKIEIIEKLQFLVPAPKNFRAGRKLLQISYSRSRR
jgi:hypothetical protein